MLPINKKNGPCDPISSNCVVWQGPDLPCVDICNGDSISAVVAGLCDQLVILQDCCGSGSGAGIDISQINQTNLDGGPAYTSTELIQLIINNINANRGTGGGHGIWDCKSTLECTLGVPECLTSINSNLTNPDTIEDILTEIMNEMCGQTQQRQGLVNSIQEANSQLSEIKRKPTGDPNPVVKSVYVDKDNPSLQPVGNLLSKVELAYGKTADNLGTESEILAALAKTPSNPLPLADPIGSRSVFNPPVSQNPTSIAQALDTAMTLITDLRKAVESLQKTSGNDGILKRMVNINTFYATGSTCSIATTNAATAANCIDLWNSTGIQFDQNVRAYTAPVAEESYELATGAWYALCPGSSDRAQYLGGATGVDVAPFWSATVTTCGG